MKLTVSQQLSKVDGGFRYLLPLLASSGLPLGAKSIFVHVGSVVILKWDLSSQKGNCDQTREE